MIPIVLGSAALIASLLFWKYHGFSLQSRGIDLAIWRDVNVTAESNLYRGLSRLSGPTIFSFGKSAESIGNKIVYNYPFSVLGVFFKNYLSFFSPEFLFLKGDTTLRQSTGMTGSFFLVLLPFMIYGLYLIVRNGTRNTKMVVLFWILVSPIPGAITRDGPGYLFRVVTMMPFLTFLSAFGIINFLRSLALIWRLIAGLVISIALVYSTYAFLFGYFHVYPQLAARNYEFGFKELSDFQFASGNVAMLVIWDGYYPSRYFRFWQQTPGDDYLDYRTSDLSFGLSVFYQRFPNLYFSLPKTEEDLMGFVKKERIPYWAVSDEFLKKNPEYRQRDEMIAQIIKYPDNTDDFVIYKSY
ncbi:MAG: PMT family glycosyltransferase, 4-amino-4-deoxy-L-arabinose transferase [Microgenomates group bacterium GW2011_GWA2_44_7]|nr:MAG: PMT family glycosyltransferase, 4-amino-4-deoxy-L-arabinose transferase [Microgenomates group bacterium GW2011_GWA2_44_7]